MSYFFLSVAFYGVLIAFPIAILSIAALYLAPRPSKAVDVLTPVAWLIWTFGALSVTYLLGDFFYYPDSEVPDRDLSFWAEYVVKLLVVFAIFFCPAGIYWFRRLRRRRHVPGSN